MMGCIVMSALIAGVGAISSISVPGLPVIGFTYVGVITLSGAVTGGIGTRLGPETGLVGTPGRNGVEISSGRMIGASGATGIRLIGAVGTGVATTAVAATPTRVGVNATSATEMDLSVTTFPAVTPCTPSF